MPVSKDVKLGKDVKIYHTDLVNIYGCEIGDGTKIGAFVEIKRTAKIGERVKIQPHVFIPEGVTIEDEVLIGPHVSFINDRYPKATNLDGSLKLEEDWNITPTWVKRGASIGANCTILCGVTIGEGAMVGAGSVVTKDVEPNTIVVGNPAKFLRKLGDEKADKITTIPFVDVKRQYQFLKQEIDLAVSRIFEQGNYILGKEVEEFEKAFAKYLKIKYCIGVSSGSAALRLGLRVLEVGPGDEVITQANTFISTILPILELGAKPVLVDIDPITYQIDPIRVEKAITKKTKVILPVHLYGIPTPMDKILKIAKKNNLKVFEDACQAHGSSFNGKKCGTLGSLAAFSFYPGKNLGAAGDGGALVTNNALLDKKIRAMRNIGQFEKYKHDIFGYNSRLDTIHAAVLLVKLKYLDDWNKKRRKIASLFNKNLSGLPVTLPPQLDSRYIVNYHLYVIRTKKRDALLRYLQENKIYAGIHYPIPIHLQKAVSNLNYKKGAFPITEIYSKEILSLPIFPEMTELEANYISDLIHKFYTFKKSRN